MSTANLNLFTPTGTDLVDLLTTYPSDMTKIDTAYGNVSQSAQSANTLAGQAKTQAQSASDASSANANAIVALTNRTSVLENEVNKAISMTTAFSAFSPSATQYAQTAITLNEIKNSNVVWVFEEQSGQWIRIDNLNGANSIAIMNGISDAYNWVLKLDVNFVTGVLTLTNIRLGANCVNGTSLTIYAPRITKCYYK